MEPSGSPVSLQTALTVSLLSLQCYKYVGRMEKARTMCEAACSMSNVSKEVKPPTLCHDPFILDDDPRTQLLQGGSVSARRTLAWLGHGELEAVLAVLVSC